MADLDELINQIPTQEIASKLGVDEGEVNSAIKTLVPALVGGIQQNVQAGDIDSSKLESDVATQGASGLLDGGVSVDQVDAKPGDQYVARIFGGNDSNAVASALAGSGAGGNDLIKRLLPILAPIVLAYIGRQLTQKAAAPAGGGAPQAQAAPSGGLGDVLGGILGGGGGGGNNPLGSILGSVLGGNQGNAIGEILGGLLGGKK
ncbi:MAG: hypothetical protein QOC63_5196 [Mycobacterium sp.]|nr:hypothetical protein [Mycobacterium sp.]